MGLHQTWKWLHQTAELHEFLICMAGNGGLCFVSNKSSFK